jgi:hypothetical protein
MDRIHRCLPLMLMNAAQRMPGGPTLDGNVLEVAVFLFRKGKSETKTEGLETQVLQAAKVGDTEKLRALVKDGADLNLRNQEQNWTALMCAVEGGHIGAAKFLIQSGADVNAEAETGTTTLMVAAISGSTELVSTLLDSGADFTAQEMHGRTALDLVNLKIEVLGHDADNELLTIRDLLATFQDDQTKNERSADALIDDILAIYIHGSNTPKDMDRIKVITRELSNLDTTFVQYIGARIETSLSHWESYFGLEVLCEVIGKIGGDDAFGILSSLLTREVQAWEYETVRLGAARGLGFLGDRRAMPLLEERREKGGTTHYVMKALDEAIHVLT